MTASIVTVVTPADSRRLTTVERLKADIGLTGNADDDGLGARIDEASSLIARHVGHPFVRETLRQGVRPERPCASLILARRPVIAIVAVTEGAVLSEADWELDGAAGLLHRLDGRDHRTLWSGPKITVEFQAGYLPPGTDGRDLPFEVEAACLTLAKTLWFASRRDPLIRSEDVPGVIRTDYWVGGIGKTGGMLPADIAQSLCGYRTWGFG